MGNGLTRVEPLQNPARWMGNRPVALERERQRIAMLRS
jgi:hypothetical protein